MSDRPTCPESDTAQTPQDLLATLRDSLRACDLCGRPCGSPPHECTHAEAVRDV